MIAEDRNYITVSGFEEARKEIDRVANQLNALPNFQLNR